LKTTVSQQLSQRFAQRTPRVPMLREFRNEGGVTVWGVGATGVGAREVTGRDGGASARPSPAPGSAPPGAARLFLGAETQCVAMLLCRQPQKYRMCLRLKSEPCIFSWYQNGECILEIIRLQVANSFCRLLNEIHSDECIISAPFLIFFAVFMNRPGPPFRRGGAKPSWALDHWAATIG
jgi:hypothetical protein